MTWTIHDAISQSRGILQDTRTPYRHSDDTLLLYYNTALSDMRRLRPDIFLSDGDVGALLGDPSYNYDTNSLDSIIPVEDQFYPLFVFYITGMVGLSDDEYANDGRAAALLNQFQVQLVGGLR